MKYGVSSYSFSQLVKAGKMTQADCIQKAKDMGFDGIEFSGLNVPDGMTEEAYVISLKEKAAAVGIEISAFLFNANILADDFDAEIARCKHMLDLASLMGVSLIRHDASTGEGKKISFTNALPILARGCKILTTYAAEKGIRTMVENHGRFCQHSTRMERLYDAVNDPNFGLLVDMGNFVCDDDIPHLAVSRLAPYAFHVHAKDFHIKSASAADPGRGYGIVSNSGKHVRGAIIGHGDVDVYHCIKALQRQGYDKYLTIEFEGIEPSEMAIEIGLENLQKYVTMLQR